MKRWILLQIVQTTLTVIPQTNQEREEVVPSRKEILFPFKQNSWLKTSEYSNFNWPYMFVLKEAFKKIITSQYVM